MEGYGSKPKRRDLRRKHRKSRNKNETKIETRETENVQHTAHDEAQRKTDLDSNPVPSRDQERRMKKWKLRKVPRTILPEKEEGTRD